MNLNTNLYNRHHNIYFPEQITPLKKIGLINNSQTHKGVKYEKS